MMKNVLLTAVFLLSVTLVSGQNAVVKDVRAKYAAALNRIKLEKAEPNSANHVTVKNHHIVPAIGPVEETIEIFAYDANDGEMFPGATLFKPYFIRKKSESGALFGNSYTEYLFDTETGELIFYFDKRSSIWAEEEVDIESRAYYDKNGRFAKGDVKMTDRETKKVIPVDEIQEDGTTGQKLSAQLKEMINLLMNAPFD